MTWMSLIFVVLTAVADAPEVKRLGRSSEIEQWEFVGVDPARAELLKRWLSHDYDFLRIAHPSAPIDEFIPAAEHYLTRACQDSGFLDAQISVRCPDSMPVAVHVKEGEKYIAGGIHVDGLSPELTNAVIRELRGDTSLAARESSDFDLSSAGGGARPPPREPPPVLHWNEGKPAQLSDHAKAEFDRIVRLTLDDEGYPKAAFDIEEVCDRAKRIVDLKIQVTSLGPPANVAKITFAGNTKDSNNELKAYLKLGHGALFTKRERQRIEKRLYESGRYIYFWVKPQPHDDGIELKISLTEYPKALRLAEQLTREQEYCLAFLRHLSDQVGGGRDLVMDYKWDGRGYRLVLSSNGQWWLLVGEQEADQFKPQIACRANTQSIMCCSLRDLSRLSVPMPDAQFTGKAEVYLSEGPDPFKFRAGWGIRSNSPERVPFRLQTSFPPVFFLALANASRIDFSNIDDGVAVLDRQNSTVRIVDKADDNRQVFEVHVRSVDEGQEFVTRMAFEEGAFRKCEDQWNSVVTSYREFFDIEAPVTSIAQFVGETHFIEDFAGRTKPLAAADLLRTIGRLADHRAFAPLDRLVMRWLTTVRNPGHAEYAESPHGDVPLTTAMWARLVVIFADELFPRYSSAWTFCREGAFMLTGDAEYYKEEYHRAAIVDCSVGPITHLIVARCLETPVPDLCGMVAESGLLRTSLSGLHSDTKPILASNTVAADVIRHLHQAIAKLDKRDFEILAKSLGIDDQSLHRLEETRKLDVNTEELLDIVWYRYLCGIVDQELARMAKLKPRGSATEKRVNR